MHKLHASIASAIVWLSALTTPAAAQTSDQQDPQCAGAGQLVERGVTIAACTALLQSGHLDSRQRSVVHTNRGLLFYYEGDVARALTDLDEATRLNPQNASAFDKRGAIFLFEDDFTRASADFSEAIRLNPQNARTYLNRAIAHDRLGDAGRAAADRAEAMRLESR